MSSGACVTCARARTAQWYADNREHANATKAEWCKRNPEKVKATSANWRIKNAAEHAAKQRMYRAENLEKEMARQARWLAENPDKMRSINATWYKANMHKVAARGARRRASKSQAEVSWDAELTELVLSEAFNLAQAREAATGFAWHVDHMIPLRAARASGLHVWSNLQVIPAWMNLTKNNRMILTEPGEWIRGLVSDLRPKRCEQSKVGA